MMLINPTKELSWINYTYENVYFNPGSIIIRLTSPFTPLDFSISPKSETKTRNLQVRGKWKNQRKHKRICSVMSSTKSEEMKSFEIISQDSQGKLKPRIKELEIDFRLLRWCRIVGHYWPKSMSLWVKRFNHRINKERVFQ